MTYRCRLALLALCAALLPATAPAQWYGAPPAPHRHEARPAHAAKAAPGHRFARPHRRARHRIVIDTRKIVREPPLVVVRRRVVEDAPRVIVRRHYIEDVPPRCAEDGPRGLLTSGIWR
jgi:hypothetical protein